MVEADPVMRAARNGFLVTIIALVAIGGYQFATRGIVTAPIIVTWIVAVLSFYVSKFYYRRADTEEQGPTDETAD
jgi:membrane protein implicated in regulation of membrane protease activity